MSRGRLIRAALPVFLLAVLGCEGDVGRSGVSLLPADIWAPEVVMLLPEASRFIYDRVAVEAYEEEGLIGRSQALGERMLGRLREMQQHHPSIGEVRGKGLFAAIELVKDRATRAPLAPFNGSSPAIARIVAEGRKRGVSFAARWNFFILAPPLVITEDELDQALDLLDELLIYADEETTR